MTKCKAPPSETGINPKLAAIAAKLDEAQAHYRSLDARDDPIEAKSGAAFKEFCALEDKLAEAIATNLEEMKLKARWSDIESDDYRVAESIVRDLRAL